MSVALSASIGIQAYSVAGLWRSIRWARCARFILGGLAALPVGIVLRLHLEPRAYALAIGAALAAYGIYMLLRRPVVLKGGERPAADVLVGALGGITGPLAALPGTWLTIWCGLRGWPKDVQRAVFQPVAVAIFLMSALWIGARGAITADTVNLFLIGLPALLAGTWLGLKLFGRLDEAAFRKVVLVLLLASGVVLIV